jgi:hypothetical protein
MRPGTQSCWKNVAGNFSVINVLQSAAAKNLSLSKNHWGGQAKTITDEAG